MHENTEAFIGQFNKLESALKKRMKRSNSTSFSSLVGEAARKDPFIRHYRDLLDSFRELRNVLVHEEGNRIIATPTDGAVTALTKLVDIYTKPKSVYELFRGKVVTVQTDDSLYNAMEEMKAFGYTYLPVYEGKACVGLLSARVLAKWLLGQYDHDGRLMIDTKEVSVGQLLEEVEKIDEVQMVSRHMDVMALMEQVKSGNSPSGVYVITENGKVHEKPLGLISSKDMEKVYASMSVEM